MFLLAVLIALAIIAVVVVHTIRMGWRFLRGDQEMVAGGSWGRQLSRRKKDPVP